MAGAAAVVHGAVSLVNAVAAGRGATLGVDLCVRAEAEAGPGRGVAVETGSRRLSTGLVARTVEACVPRAALERCRVRVRIESGIPTGYGLKSSSAISTAVAMACLRAFGGRAGDSQVLLAGVEASVRAGVSITGAYDDACACYYGGFAVTDNTRRRMVRSGRCPGGLCAVIFVPRRRRRGNPRRLRAIAPVFERAWDAAAAGRYWEAMAINGLAAAPALGPDPKLLLDLAERGALAASVSGNGPAVAAVARRDRARDVARAFAGLEGRTVVAGINNRKAHVRDA